MNYKFIQRFLAINADIQGLFCCPHVEERDIIGSERKYSNPLISLGLQLKNCPRVLTLGLRSSLLHYTGSELTAIRNADVIFFPSTRYMDVFRSSGKTIYPSYSSYAIGGSMLKQVVFFKLADIPHPKTLICMARDGMGKVLANFAYPFVGVDYRKKNPSLREWRIAGTEDLIRYLRSHKLCMFTELAGDQNVIKVVVLDSEVVFSYLLRGDVTGEKFFLKELDMLPEEVQNITEKILFCSDINHFVAEFGKDGKSECYLLRKLNYVLPVRELTRMGFEPYAWLCEKICSGDFSYLSGRIR